jgi:hypothetical protein
MNHHNKEVPFLYIDDRLHCPICRAQDMHQRGVAVFYREQEDAPTTMIAVDGLAITLALDSPENPSLRRDGLTIDMECEHCLGISAFAIWQHKGGTFLAWAKVGKARR